MPTMHFLMTMICLVILFDLVVFGMLCWSAIEVLIALQAYVRQRYRYPTSCLGAVRETPPSQTD